MNGTEPDRPSHDDRFQITQRLGAGGMGVVYRAVDQVRRSEIAIKFLKHVDGDTLFRFKNEFRALADLSHPNLVSLHELLSLGDEWYFTMDLVEGVPFDQYLGVAPVEGSDTPTLVTLTSSSAPSMPDAAASASLRPREPLRSELFAKLWPTLAQLTEGVAALHRAGKLHRDLKPSNVLVTPAGRVVVCDFGLVAELADAGLARVPADPRAGTPAYMAPEQAAGQPLSEATDWYSVGIMLYQVLTGRFPFVGDAARMRWLKNQSEPPAPRHWVPELPAEIDALCMALLRRDPGMRAGSGEILALCGRRAAVPTRAESGNVAGSTPFVGRASEQHHLRQALAATRHGHSVTVFVHGSSGIGKTALLRRFLDELPASEHTVVLAGRCYERESMPYKALDAVVDALAAHLHGLPYQQVEQLLPPDVHMLARLFPVLRRVEAIGKPAQRRLDTPDPHESRRRALGALRALLGNLAARWPVVLFIDDLQWGDLDSAPFLVDLIHHVDAPPVLLLASLRREDMAQSPILRRLREARPVADGQDSPAPRAGDVREIALEPLTPAEAEALGRELLPGAGARAASIARESGGSPLFVLELARADAPGAGAGHRGDGTGARGLEHVLLERIGQLSAEARSLLTAVALAGRPTALPVLAQSVGVSDEPALVNELRSARLVRTRTPDGTVELECYHDRIREAVVADLDGEARSRLHLGLALALEASASVDAQALVEHFHGAGEGARAQRYAVLAATRAEEALAFHRAVDHLVLALDLGARDADEERQLRARLAHALANAGRLGEAARAFASAAEGAPADESLDLRRRACESLLLAGHVQEGIELARDVARQVGIRIPRTVGRTLLSALLRRLQVRVRGLGFKQRSEAEIGPAVLRRLDVCWSLSNGVSFVNPTLGLSFQAQHLLEALRAGELSRVLLALCNEIGYRSFRGTVSSDAVDELCAYVRQVAERSGRPQDMAICFSCIGLAHSLSGRWRGAYEHFTLSEKLFRDHGTQVRYVADLTQVYQLGALLQLGETRELTRLLPRYLEEANERGDQYAATRLRSWRSNCAWLILDQPEEARRMAQGSADPPVSQAFHLQHYFELLASCRVDLYLGDGASAWRRLQERWPDLTRSRLLRIQSIRIEAFALRGACALAAPGAPGERAARRLLADAAVKQVERDHAPWGDALGALLRAGCAAARGDKPAAVDLLADAAARLAGADMALCAQVARRRHGELLGGDEGRALVDASTQWMKHQGVVKPARITAMFAPGF